MKKLGALGLDRMSVANRMLVSCRKIHCHSGSESIFFGSFARET